MRLITEQRERELLSPWAAQSSKARRKRAEAKQCDLRTSFQVDRDRIIHSKAFRRLKDKTQVWIAPEGAHYRTRLSHTLELAQIARTIARCLSLNEDLTEAIALGHDLGHSPFGHAGEEQLRLCHGQFEHNEQSLRIVEELEREGRGLNLTLEVLDGILNHTGETPEPFTLEGQIVKIADRIAYVNHDIDDAIRAGILRPTMLPAQCVKILGQTHGERIDTLVRDMVEQSQGQPRIRQSPEVKQAMADLRQFMFEKVYLAEVNQAEARKGRRIVKELYEFFIRHPTELPETLQQKIKQGTDLRQATVDYIAGMTDIYAVRCFQRRFIPGSRFAAYPFD
ncbi:MAG: deoxyguanosinetriphosphate triphosphohydrolase [Syntrophomonadaceae bacterium]|nr:deoxyguanosinetriphosphate triphosphohydrolase [Syntrophomonadaceae bacterium]